jgi:hypothetical protein
MGNKLTIKVYVRWRGNVLDILLSSINMLTRRSSGMEWLVKK